MTTKEDWDKFAIETIPKLKKLGYLKDRNGIFKAIGYMVLGLFFCLIFVYAINSDAFKSIISQDVSCPNITIPACPNINIPACPLQICNNTCTFPNNISIKLSNTTT